MKFTADLKLMRFNLAEYKRHLHRAMTDAIQDAAKEYLKAVLFKIPVWSGASHATFQDLADAVSYSLNIRPLVGSRTQLGKSHSYGNVIFGPKQYLFKYQTSLPHLVYNEYNNGNVSPGLGQFGLLVNPGPYGFQKLGEAAALRIRPRLRSPLDFIVTTPYKIR